MRYHYTPIRMAKIFKEKNMTILSVDEAARTLHTLLMGIKK